MNTIDFNKNNFPLTSSVLGFLQSAAQMLEKLTSLVGGNYIISGCVTTGGSVSSGYVVVNGELMYFGGGSLQTYVRVETTETPITVQDATYTKTEKQLIFGSGTGQIEYSTFKRAEALLQSNGFINPNNLRKGDEDNPGIFRWATLLEFRESNDSVNDIPLVVRPSHIKNKSPYTTIVLSPDWSGNVDYYLDNVGNVHISGRDLSYSSDINATTEVNIFTMPVGFRPVHQLYKPISGKPDIPGTNYIHTLRIQTNGVVSVKGAPDTIYEIGTTFDFYVIYRGA